MDASAALAAKDKGNALYKAGKNEEAIEAYANGLPLCDSTSDVALAIHKNMAACHLKLVRVLSLERGACKMREGAWLGFARQSWTCNLLR